MKNLNNWTWPKLKLTNLLEPTNLNFTSGVLLTSVLDVFFCWVKQGWAGVPASASLRARARGPVQADHTSIFLGVKIMFVGVMNFGHVPKLRFVCVKIFWSKSNQSLVILIRSCCCAEAFSPEGSSARCRLQGWCDEVFLLSAVVCPLARTKPVFRLRMI